MTRYIKFLLPVALLTTIFILSPRPASAELTNEEKIERCNNNILRIVALSQRAEELKKLLAYKISDENSLRATLLAYRNAAAEGNDKEFRRLAMQMAYAYHYNGENIRVLSKEKLNLDWKKEYDDWMNIVFSNPSVPFEQLLAEYLKAFRPLLQDLIKATDARIEEIKKAIEDRYDNEAELRNINEQLAGHKSALEKYNCKELMNVQSEEPLGEMIEQGKLPAADPDAWGLVEVISDPGKLTESAKYKQTIWLPTAVEIEKMETGHYELHHQAWSDASQSKLTQDFHINVQWDAPPASIKPGQNFSLHVAASCTRTTEDMGGWVSRFGSYEAGGGIAIKTTAQSMEKPYVGNGGDAGFVGNANATYEFTVPPAEQLSSEFVIEQKGAAIFKYKKGAQPIVVPKP